MVTYNISLIVSTDQLNEQLLKVEIFPNPFSDGKTIEWDMDETKVSSMLIFNGMGQLVKSEILPTPLNEGIHFLKLADLPPGVYWIFLETDQGGLLNRILKK